MANIASYRSRFKDDSIYDALVNGTDKEIQPDIVVQSKEVVIKRKEQQQKIRNVIDADDALFGVVIGPTGTGKTHLTRLACCEPHTPGVLYHEIGDAASFPHHLVKTIGMKLKSSFNALDLVIWNLISEQYVSYHTLPKDQEEATHYVINTLAETSKKFKKKYERVPCLVIDGVDKLAKKNENSFIQLVDLAKLYANDRKLYLVLVSSEGNIMPLINKTSARTRMAKVVEILDIDDDDAVQYLSARGFSEDTAEKVVKHVGGRFVYLKKAAEIRRLNPTLDGDTLLRNIKSELYSSYVNPGVMEMGYHRDKAKIIIDRSLRESTPLDPQTLRKDLKGDELTEMVAAIKCLVKENILRYDADGKLTWHSRLVHGALASENPKSKQ